MKKLITLVAVMAAFLFASPAASAFNAIERTSQMAVLNYLNNQGYDTRVDNDDNSVMFFIEKKIGKKVEKKFYYITFKGDGKGVLYTLHAAPVKFEFEDKDVRARKMEAAEKAGNLMNPNGPVKVYLANNRLNFTYPIFAKNPDDYLKVLPNLIDEIDKTRDNDYDFYLKKGEAKTDSIHKYWAKNDPDKIVVRQPNNNVGSNQRNLTVSDPYFRNVDANGNQLDDYNARLRKVDLRYVQPKVTVTSPNKGNFKLGVKIINPKGKILVPTPESNMTIVSVVEADKKGKVVELGWFGTDQPDFWEVGQYNVIFYEDDNELYRINMDVW